MIAEKLRKAILQAAIQGKLTEQLPEDGDARELLEEIKAEKALLVKEGKIKKEKPIPEITEDEMPFDIPENWCWTRLNECLDVRDGTHDTPKYVSQGIPLITSKNLNNGELDFSTAKFISEKDSVAINNRSRVDNEDILFAMIGSIGNPVLVKKEQEFSIKNVALFKNVCQKMNMQYVYFYLCLAQEEMKRISSGGVQVFVSLGFLRNYLIPIPPLSEQHRMVNKIIELKPVLFELMRDEFKLDLLQKSFPKKMKDSLLQAAIQGKLTEQLESDGDARALVADIKKEKERLIKEGKIKKEKALPEITEDEIPFDIPESWCWVRIGDIIILKSGQDMTPDKYSSVEKGISYITGASNFVNGSLNIDRWTTVPRSIADAGDLLITCKGTVGEMAFLKHNSAHIARQVMAIKPIVGVDIRYIRIYLSFYVNQLKSMAKSMIPGISRDMILVSLLPLPPLAEQQRIVERLEQLLPLCDALE